MISIDPGSLQFVGKDEGVDQLCTSFRIFFK